ncbi:Uncharacterised protein [Kluyvera cryocrescens]|uniref:Uncharacterized protein n=1 Tax=Kluyvera cryocrescens TaxID=580 RepID=A0A485ASP5_KLUCR|nr:Uncharacterised protein [Kluyvera cryocrescens]
MALCFFLLSLMPDIPEPSPASSIFLSSRITTIGITRTRANFCHLVHGFQRGNGLFAIYRDDHVVILDPRCAAGPSGEISLTTIP